VVGYCAVAIYGENSASAEPSTEGELNHAQQKRLLSLARSAIEQHVRKGPRLEIEETDPALLRPGAAFVTLRKQGVLRGCIGILEAKTPLIETVRDRAIMAATRDPRFPPVQPDELSRLEVEVSVLSPLQQVQTADEIDISKHGVVVQQGARSGVFLPQVAQETRWSRDLLLTHLCRDKAGLPSDAWKRGATLYVFTVQAFSSPAIGEEQGVAD
jgi:AmmeMemoRadiSam system protein A